MIANGEYTRAAGNLEAVGGLGLSSESLRERHVRLLKFHVGEMDAAKTAYDFIVAKRRLLWVFDRHLEAVPDEVKNREFKE